MKHEDSQTPAPTTDTAALPENLQSSQKVHDEMVSTYRDNIPEPRDITGWVPTNTIEVKHDLLKFSDGDNIMTRPADEIVDISVTFVSSNGTTDRYAIFVCGAGVCGEFECIWTYKCGPMEEAHELHDKVFNAWVEARVVAQRSR